MMKVNVLFGDARASGRIEVKYGKLASPAEFRNTARVTVKVEDANLKTGSKPTIVTVFCADSFSFNLRDVSSEYPVYISEYRAAVLPGDDGRSYEEVARDIALKGLVSDFDRMQAEPEETYENACQYNRDKYSPVWLGVGGDIRIFTVSPQQLYNLGCGQDFQYWGKIKPRYHSYGKPAEPGNEHSWYDIFFEIGPGAHCRPRVTHRLDQGVLPILHSVQDEQDIQYNVTAFATLENGPLGSGRVRGTDWRAAYAKTGNHMLKPDELEELQKLIESETTGREEEVVCVVRVEAVNTAKMPAYAWFKAAHAVSAGTHWSKGCSYLNDQVAAVNRMNGEPMPEEEMAILVNPGEKAVFEMLIPHNPLPEKRALKLLDLDYRSHLDACRSFWLGKLEKAAKISVPETAIDERIRAGLLHLDLMTTGMPAAGPLLPTIGWYSPIGTESAPIIQYFDSVGLGETAGRCIDFFLERQRKDGFIQNFANYQSETGPLLWTAAEHFRYTGDLKWLKKATPRLKKSCDFLLAWRERNKKEEYKERGFYGLIDGKVADPNDFYHSFFLNAGTYAGLSGMAEVLINSAPAYAKKLAAEVELYRQDIINAVEYASAHAPVLPLGDGTWGTLLPPWVEYTGGISFYADGGNWFSHGAFASRSSLTGAFYFAITDIFPAQGKIMNMMLKTNQHPITRENAALSQPYYSRHDLAHIKRGDVKLFLKVFYNQMTALQDRRTYGFWEHYYNASEYKTHEEGWFLMQIRWMLYLENGNSLELFKAVPRRWLEPGRKITLDGVRTYFGALNAKVEAAEDRITCSYLLERPAEKIVIRLPHPQGQRALKCTGGVYDPVTESVTVSKKKGTVTLQF